MKVIILGAGQGKRLLPLTEMVPKALLDIGGRSLVGRQVDAFVACGVREFVVVTGYGDELMEKALAELASDLGVEIRTVYNPFYRVSDNLASCWMARHEMTGDFIQVNGDNIFRADLVDHFLKAPDAEVTVAINHKNEYDADDMKVMMDGQRVTEIGKALPLEAVDAEAIGFYLFRGDGGAKYAEVLDRMVREPQGLKQWFVTAVAGLSKMIDVNARSFDNYEWCEVDFPADLQHARHVVAGWERS
ncbi:MAG: phosphocholine cytidylyltransferase family protein [Pseudomonadota bacterium]